MAQDSPIGARSGGRRARAGLLLLLLLSAGASPQEPQDGARAWSFHLRGEHERAIEEAQALLAANPNDPLALVARTDALAALRRGAESRHPLEAGRRALVAQDPAAGRLLAQALADARARGDSIGSVLAQTFLGAARCAAGQPAEGEARLQAALELAGGLDHPLLVTLASLELGHALLATPRRAEATAHLEAALARAQALRLPRWVGDAYIDLSRLARWEMDLDRSYEYRMAALEAYQAAGHQPGVARARHYLAVIQLIRGELTRALDLLHEALAGAYAAGDSGEAATCLGDLGVLHYLVGDDRVATSYFQEAVDAAGARRPREWVAGMLSNTGMVQLDLGRTAEALATYQAALELISGSENRRVEIAILNSVGRCLWKLGSREQSLARLREGARLAREWGLTLKEAQALCDLGNCLIMSGQPAEAESALTQAAALAQARAYFDVAAPVLAGRARLARYRGQLDEALRLMEEAIDIIEGVRARSRGSAAIQSGFFGSKSHVYEEAVDLLWEIDPQGHARRAFALAQRAKARAFLDLLTEAGVDLRVHGDPRYQEREQQIETRISDLLAGPTGATATAEIARLEDELALLEETLRRDEPRYADLRYPRPAGPDEVQAELLRPRELLIEYFLGDSTSFAWGVTREEFHFLRLPPRETIEHAAWRVLPLLQDYNLLGDDPTYFIDPVAHLSAMILAPILERCGRPDHVTVVPDGILHYLPLEILFTVESPPADADFATLPYLVRVADVTYAPSISTLALVRQSDAPARSNLLLVGDPARSAPGEETILARTVLGGDLPPLPTAAAELRRIAALFANQVSAQLTGADATPAALQEALTGKAYHLVHLAAHGFFNEQRPRFSGLLLAPDGATGDDGFLSIGEVFGLEMACDQIVLSACSSALGEQVTGEGLIGLTRAFLYAGARSVVAALWEVAGQPTTDFMAAFYDAIRTAPGADRAAGLAAAKRHFITGGTPRRSAPAGPCLAHPYFWAAFVLTGDGR